MHTPSAWWASAACPGLSLVTEQAKQRPCQNNQRGRFRHFQCLYRCSYGGGGGGGRASFEQGGGEGVLDPKLGVPKMA